MLLHQMGDDFRVGFGRKFMPFFCELSFKGEIVFYDSVVDHDYLAGAVAVRMGIFLARTPVGGPTCMADSVSAVALQRLETDDLFQVPQFALGPAYLEAFMLPVAVACNRDAGGVVPAIFETTQPFNNYGNHTLFTYVTNNSTHSDVLVDDFQ